MDSEKIIGRIEVYEKIKSRFEKSNPKVTITSIGGSGGIGKTYLLNKLLEDTFLDDSPYLVLFPETKKIDSFEKYITEGMLNSANGVLPVTEGYFNETSKLIKVWKELENKRKKELLKYSQKNAELKEIDDAIIDDIFNVIGIFSNAFLEYKELKKYLGEKGLTPKQCEEMANLLKNLKKKGIHNPFEGRVPDFSRKRTIRYNVINDFNEAACNAMLNDISYILGNEQGIKEKIKFKATRGSEAKKMNNLVVIIDDYELYQEQLNAYFLDYFIPGVRKKPFNTQIILVGRDLILDTSAEWDKYVKDIEQFEITTFDRESCMEYLNSLDIYDEEIIERLISDTEGYPYMLYLEAISYKSGGDISAHKKKLFYDRITKWMNGNEKVWFEALCFLDVINIDTVKKMLPNDDGEKVFYWFANQASIRDSKSIHYRVKPFLKSKTMDYLQSKSPEYYEELYNLACPINNSFS